MNGGEVLVETLVSRDVDTVFFVPGGTYTTVLRALSLRTNQVRSVAARLESAGIEAICDAATTLSEAPPDELARRAEAAWNIARENHTRATFASHYDDFVNDVVLPEVEHRRVRS